MIEGVWVEKGNNKKTGSREKELLFETAWGRCFLVSKKLTWRKEELTGSWRERGTGRVNVVVLRSTACDSGLVEGDIIPLLPPQEIRSQQEPRPSGERRLFQARSTGTQMNAFMIRTHIHTIHFYTGLLLCVRGHFQNSSTI